MPSSAELVIKVLADTSGATGEISKLGGTLGKVLGIGALGGAAALMTDAAAQWQDSMAHIVSAYNTVDFQPGTAKFEEVQSFLRDLSTRTATSSQDLAEIFNVAARYAPDSTQKAEEFTNAVARLTKVSADLNDPVGTSQHLAQFLRIFNQTNAEGVASAIAQLGTMHTQGEGPVLEMAQQMAQAGAQFGMTEAQVLGLSNVLVDVGERVNTGGSSITRMFLELGQAAAAAGTGVDENSKKIRDGGQRVTDLQSQIAIAEQRRAEMNGAHGLKAQYKRHPSEVMSADENIRRLHEQLSNAQQDLAAATDPEQASRQIGQRININEAAKIAGVSRDDFIAQFQSDSFGAFTSIIGGLHGMPEGDQATALGKLGIKNIRDIKTIEALASRFDNIDPNVSAAQGALDAGAANPATDVLGQRGAPILDDTLSKMHDLGNAAQNAMAELGEPMRKVLDQTLTGALELAHHDLGSFDDGILKVTGSLDGFDKALAAAGVMSMLGGAGNLVGGAGGGSLLTKAGGLVTSIFGGGAAALPTALLAALAMTAGSIKLGLDNPDLVNYVAQNPEGSTGGGEQRPPSQVTVNVGDVHATSLDQVLEAVRAQITSAWNAAMGGHPVTGQQGGSYTTGQAPL